MLLTLPLPPRSRSSFARLPGSTVVYCGHEYTASNLAFALTVDADNQSLQAKAAWAKRCVLPYSIRCVRRVDSIH